MYMCTYIFVFGRKYCSLFMFYLNIDFVQMTCHTEKTTFSLLSIFSQEIEPQKCEPCAEQGRTSTAASYCASCNENLCQKCTEQHKALKATRTHVLSSVSERKVCKGDFTHYIEPVLWVSHLWGKWAF